MPVYVGKRSTRYFGEANVPHDVNRRRRYVHDIMRRMGTPIVHKHRLNDLDYQRGTAAKAQEAAPDLLNEIYDQPRNWDPLSHGVGYVGAVDGEIVFSEDEWFHPNWSGSGNFIWREGVDGDTPPTGYIPAPKYRGFGEGTLVYIIMPDRAEDFFKASVGGPLFKVQEAYAIAPWFPDINDNDLIVPVELTPGGQIVNMDAYGRIPIELRADDRFEAKMTSPVSIRGTDRRGARESPYGDTWGNRHVINQTFEMALLPMTDVAYSIEMDR